jgi:hypothetical protein
MTLGVGVSRTMAMIGMRLALALPLAGRRAVRARGVKRLALWTRAARLVVVALTGMAVGLRGPWSVTTGWRAEATRWARLGRPMTICPG